MWKLREFVGHETLKVAKGSNNFAFFQSRISYMFLMEHSAAVNAIILF